MKKIIVTINTICGIVLLLLLITMVGKNEYAEVVLEGPIFFGDIFLIFAVLIGPAIIGRLIGFN